MKKAYVRSNCVTGFDWHDISWDLTQLEENNSYGIKNPVDVIAKDILERILFCCEMTLEQVKEALLSKEESTIFQATVDEEIVSDDGLDVQVNPYEIVIYSSNSNQFSNNYGFVCSYGCGYNYYTEYRIDYIEEGKEEYLVTEDIPCPTKGVPLLQKCYHGTFKSLKEANEYKNTMNEKTDNEGVFKLAVVDGELIKDNEWYKKQMLAVQ